MMNRISILKILSAVFTSALLLSSCHYKSKDVSFSFAFMTDIHLQTERNATEGFKMAINSLNDLNPDFVITGGDLIMDALGQRYSYADSLYNLYIETVKGIRMPVYNTIGNHELFGIYNISNTDSLNPEYGEKMFEKRLGNSYYSFMHKGWKFIILNSVEEINNNYTGKIDNDQINWIRNELRETDPKTPLVISTHIPFITASTQKYQGSTVSNSPSTVISNGKEVLDLFTGYNLKIVLQGHLHLIEDIFIDGIHFITGGAVSGAWWAGPSNGIEEGYVLVTINNNDVSWKYIDYGWNII